jgi:hypothetical protein
MDVRLTSVCTVGRISFKFGMQEFIHHGPVPGEYEHPKSKNGASLKLNSKHKMAIFSITAQTNLIKFRQFIEIISSKKSA